MSELLTKVVIDLSKPKAERRQIIPLSAEEIAEIETRQTVGEGREREKDALRQQIRTLAQGAVGKPLNALTAAEVRALMALLLHKAGGVADDATVRPLSDWL